MPQVRCSGCGAVATVLNQGQVNQFNQAHASCYPRGQSMGLGDVVAAGIKKVFGIAPCGGCERRAQYLNKLAPRVWRR